jgi:hypothetical protein
MQGAFTPEGRLFMLGRTLQLWNRFPESEATRPDLSITGYQFFGGDGGAVVVAGDRLYIPEYNGNRIVAYRRYPDRADQRPDFAIGSPEFATNTLRREFLIINNRTPAGPRPSGVVFESRGHATQPDDCPTISASRRVGGLAM